MHIIFNISTELNINCNRRIRQSPNSFRRRVQNLTVVRELMHIHIELLPMRVIDNERTIFLLIQF